MTDEIENIGEDASGGRSRIKVVSLAVDLVNYETATARIAKLIERGKGGYVCISTVHMAMEGFDNAEYAAQVNRADLITPDGMPMVWMQKLQGAKTTSQVRGTTLMMKLFVFAEANKLSVGFYGGRQTVLDEIAARLQTEHPSLSINCSYSPPFKPLSDEENTAVIKEINESAPDILFVGLGCPKQERWMAEHADKLSTVMLGVGAAFDFYAGNVSECPAFLRKFGLEWFYRLLHEPRRLWRRYLILNPRFIWHAARQLLASKNRSA